MMGAPDGTSMSNVPPAGIPADVWALARTAYGRRPIRTEGIALAIMADRANRPHSPAPRVGGLTANQKRVHEYLASFVAAHGIAPSYDEIRIHFGLASKSAVHRVIGELEERGAIRRLPNRSRAITIIATPTGA